MASALLRWIRTDQVGLTWVCGVAVSVFAGGVAAHFMGRFWWPPDEGVYAYVAWRILEGARLHLDVQDVHPGYVHYLHALSFELFGERLSSLRIPLAVLTVLHTVVGFVSFRRAGMLRASLAAVALASFSFVQFLNPSANWYALSLTVFIVAALSSLEDGPRRTFLLGALLGLLLLTRHPTAVFVGAGVLGLVLSGERSEAVGPARLAKTVMGLLIAVILAWLTFSTGPVGLLLIGIWPLMVLAGLISGLRMDDLRTVAVLGTFLAGALVAMLPLFVQLTVHGSWSEWIQDVGPAALRLAGLPMIDAASYLDLLLPSLGGLVSGDPAVTVNAALWLCLLASPSICGILALREVKADPTSTTTAVTVIASCHGLVAIHYQIPIYLLFTSGLSLAAITLALPRRPMRVWAVVLPLLCAVALTWQAGEPLSRSVRAVARGEGGDVPTRQLGGRVGLEVSESSAAVYERILEIVDTRLGPDEHLLVLPMSAEIYFLAEEVAPTRWYASFLGVDDSDPGPVLEHLSAKPPALLIIRDELRYMTPGTQQLIEALSPRYRCLERVGPFEVLRRMRPGDPRPPSRCG